LPAEAFLSPLAAIAALESRSFATLSYRWLTREHPDPNAFHLGKLRKALVTLNHAAIAGRDGREGGGEGGDGGLRYSALFMDFMCCPQRDANGHKLGM